VWDSYYRGGQNDEEKGNMATMRKILKLCLIGLVFVILAIAGIERLAAERIEVIELVALDTEGVPQTTRLWVVDADGMAYLRVGSGGSGWYSRILANDSVAVIRQGMTANYTVQARPEKSARINQLMRSKYTWGDAFIGLLTGGREGSIPLELQPL
jgi:hypothetical protein